MTRYRAVRAVCVVFIILISVAIMGNPVESSAQSGRLSREAQAFQHYRDGLLLAHEGRYEEAITQLQRAARLDTSTIILKALGDIYIQPDVRQYDMAAGVYERYLEKNPNDDRTIGIILQIYSQTNRLNREESILTKVIIAGNDRPEYYSRLIDIYLRQEKIEDAQNMSILYLEKAGESEQSSQQVAELFIRNSAVDQGVVFFARYIQDHPDVDNMGITLGILYEAGEDFNKAEDAYKNVLRKNQFASLARGSLAAIYMRAGRIDDALKLYDGIPFDDPSEIPVKVQITQMLLSSNNPDVRRAEGILLSAADNINANAQLFYLLGYAQESQSKTSEAEESYRTAVKLEPSNIIALNALSNILYTHEKFKEGLDTITRAVKYKPDYKQSYIIKGLIEDRLGDTEAALASYEAGISVTSADKRAEPTLYNNYSYILAQNDRDLDKALEYAKKAVLADPENSSFLDTIGWVYFKLGKLEDSLEYIKKSAARDPGNAEVLDHLGDVYEKMGELELAAEFWEKAVQLDQSNEIIKEKLRRIRR
ncbi:tetratricopeptide repeat protein [candidate division KSB1 bacterium]